jgi:hypothetical protein
MEQLVINKQIRSISAMVHAEGSFEFHLPIKAGFPYSIFEVVNDFMRSLEVASTANAYSNHWHRLRLLATLGHYHPERSFLPPRRWNRSFSA